MTDEDNKCISCKKYFQGITEEELLCFGCFTVWDRTNKALAEVSCRLKELCKCGHERKYHEEGMGYCFECRELCNSFVDVGITDKEVEK